MDTDFCRLDPYLLPVVPLIAGTELPAHEITLETLEVFS
jgi:hypothetical protein